MKTRFDLEDEIMKLYAFVDNIDDAVEYLIDSDVDPKVVDGMSNILLGTSTLLGLHAEKMLDTMRQCFKLDQYREATISSELSELSYRETLKTDLTNADDPVITKCSGNCPTRTSSECSGKFYSDPTMSSFEYQ